MVECMRCRCERVLAANPPAAGNRPVQPDNLHLINSILTFNMNDMVYILKAAYYLVGIAAFVKKLLER